MGKPVQNAFTLIELLVVIAIMAIIGVFTLANYRSFGEDQNLKNAVLDIVSLLRQAQANATTNVICSNGTWQVNFVSTTSINLQCSTSANPQKVLQLDKNDPNISITSVSGTSCPTGASFTLTFVPLSGKINFVGYANCTVLTIILTNSKTTNTKSLVIEQGGRIYAP